MGRFRKGRERMRGRWRLAEARALSVDLVLLLRDLSCTYLTTLLPSIERLICNTKPSNQSIIQPNMHMQQTI